MYNLSTGYPDHIQVVRYSIQRERLVARLSRLANCGNCILDQVFVSSQAKNSRHVPYFGRFCLDD